MTKRMEELKSWFDELELETSFSQCELLSKDLSMRTMTKAMKRLIGRGTNFVDVYSKETIGDKKLFARYHLTRGASLERKVYL